MEGDRRGKNRGGERRGGKGQGGGEGTGEDGTGGDTYLLLTNHHTKPFILTTS